MEWPGAESFTRQFAVFALLCGMAIIAILYFAKEVLLPFALATLLSFLLAPLVERLEKWRVARVPAVLIAVAVSFVGVGAIGFVLFQQIYEVAFRLPEYEQNLTNKARAFQGNDDGVIARITKALEDVRTKLAKEASGHIPQRLNPKESAPPLAPAVALSPDQLRTTSLPSERLTPDGTERLVQPVPVEIVDSVSAVGISQRILGPMLAPFGTAAMVIVLVTFMLLKREDLRNRVIHMIGSHQMNFTTQALDDAGQRVSRYLRMQLIINASFGLLIALGLFLIGVPNSLMWGIFAGALRFVPLMGAFVASLIPFAISLAIFDGWTRPVLVLALFAVDELIASNVLEPRLYASSTGISALGVLIATIFWMWLWGPVGLILAMPLTVCLVVMASYVPQLAFLNTLLSDQPVLATHSRFYQRLLAFDLEEALEVAEDYLKDNTVESLYDDVLVPALGLAEQDRHHGDLEESKERFINRTVRELIEDLGLRPPGALFDDGKDQEREPDAASVLEQPISVLCFPARDEADEIVALMLAQLLAARGLKTRVLSVAALVSEMIGEVDGHTTDVVCVSALPPFAATHARYLCKKLLPRVRNEKVVAGLWQTNGSAKKAQERLAATGVDRCVTTLAEATEQIANLVASARLLDAIPK